MYPQLKVKAADNLAPIRRQIADLIEPNSTVIEFGCGNGDLLLGLSPKIKYGLGIDKSKVLINHAIKRKESLHISNLDFLCEELGRSQKRPETYDFSLASLFFHVLSPCQAVYLLNELIELSGTVLICAISRPQTPVQKVILWLDQRFSGNYGHFAAYQKNGYFEGILANIQYSSIITYATFLPFIKIYKIS